MKFEYPYLLFLLSLMPVLAAFYILIFSKRKKAVEKFAQEKLIEKLAFVSSEKQKIKAILIIIAVFFIIIALARPQFGTKLVEIKRHGSDVVLAVDVSNSMLAEDVKPSRIERAKMILSELIHQLQGNKIGIIAFAGTAFWQCPLTLDVTGANLFLQLMNTELIPLQGTAIGDAVRLALKDLSKTKEKTKTIVLITDGEDHKSDPLGAAREAEKEKVKIFTLGIGNKNGEPIPIRDENGKFNGYKKDKTGNIIMSKMNESQLIEIAETTGGQYFDAGNAQINVIRLVDTIKGMEKSKLSSNMNKQYEDKYQYILFFGLVLLIIELFVSETRRNSKFGTKH